MFISKKISLILRNRKYISQDRHMISHDFLFLNWFFTIVFRGKLNVGKRKKYERLYFFSPAAMAAKARQSLSLKRKIEIIDYVEKNPCKQRQTIATELRVPPSTLSKIIKDKQKYLQLYETSKNPDMKHNRGPKLESVDRAFDLVRNSTVCFACTPPPPSFSLCIIINF